MPGGGAAAVDGGQPLEREAVLAAITTLVNEVRAGRGGALFVVGEAGLGKTTSLSQARELAVPAVRVGLGRGDVMETSLPFGVLAAALGAVGNHDLVASPPGVQDLVTSVRPVFMRAALVGGDHQPAAVGTG